MLTPCQRILQSYLIHFLGTFSTDYFSQFLPIVKCSPKLLPHHSPISTANLLLPDCYYNCYMLGFLYTGGRAQSHPEINFSSPTWFPHGRHDQGGIGRKLRQDCSTSIGIEMQNFWRHWHPFSHHHLQRLFSVQEFSPPLLQILRGGALRYNGTQAVDFVRY